MKAQGCDEHTLPPDGLIQWPHEGHSACRCWPHDGDTQLSSLAPVWLVSYAFWWCCWHQLLRHACWILSPSPSRTLLLDLLWTLGLRPLGDSGPSLTVSCPRTWTFPAPHHTPLLPRIPLHQPSCRYCCGCGGWLSLKVLGPSSDGPGQLGGIGIGILGSLHLWWWHPFLRCKFSLTILKYSL